MEQQVQEKKTSLGQSLKAWFKKKTHILFSVSILLVLLGGIFGMLFQTDFGNIQVTNITVQDDNSQYVNADVFRPKNATAENKAPCVIVVPGFQRTKETSLPMSLELAKRGIVTICLDPYSQGVSSSTHATQSATVEGYGLKRMVNYVFDSGLFPYVDLTKVGAVGHSAGGNACIRMADYFGKLAIDIGASFSRLQSIYVTGYVLTLTDDVMSNWRCNAGISYAINDEGAYRNENAGKINPSTGKEYNPADMRYAPEAIRFVNSGLSLHGDAKISEVTIDKTYASPIDGTMRVVANPNVDHVFQPYNTETLAKMVEFFDLSFQMDMTLSYSSVTWMYKEAASGIALVGGLLFILEFGALLLETKLFKSLVKEGTAYGKKKDWKGWVHELVLIAIGATIAAVDFIPLCDLSKVWFSEAANGALTWNFPARMSNGVMLWAVVNGLAGLTIMFLDKLLFLQINRAKAKSEEEKSLIKKDTWKFLSGFQLEKSAYWKTPLLALMVFVGFYLLDLLSYLIFHVDMRIFFVNASPLTNWKYLVPALMYIPFFFIFYFANSVKTNLTMKFEQEKKWVSYLFAILANSLGLVALQIVQYVAFAKSGQVYWTDDWLYINMLWSIIPMMILLPLFNRFFYDKTNNAYLGAEITCPLFIVMMLTGTVVYVPWFIS